MSTYQIYALKIKVPEDVKLKLPFCAALENPTCKVTIESFVNDSVAQQPYTQLKVEGPIFLEFPLTIVSDAENDNDPFVEGSLELVPLILKLLDGSKVIYEYIPLPRFADKIV